MSFNGIINTELANTEPLLLGETQGYSTGITLFYVCFCLKTSYLIYIVMHNTELTADNKSGAWTKLI